MIFQKKQNFLANKIDFLRLIFRQPAVNTEVQKVEDARHFVSRVIETHLIQYYKHSGDATHS